MTLVLPLTAGHLLCLRAAETDANRANLEKRSQTDPCRQDSNFPVELRFGQKRFNHDITLEHNSFLDRPSQRALVRVVEFFFPSFEM